MTNETSEFKKVITKPDDDTKGYIDIIHDEPLLWKRSEETKNKLHDIIEEIIKENPVLSVATSSENEIMLEEQLYDILDRNGGDYIRVRPR